LRSSTSFAVDEDTADGRVGVLVAAPGDPEIVESLFFASATVPPLDGFETGAAERLVVVPVALVVLVTGLIAGLGLDELIDVAGFLAVVVVAAFVGDWCVAEGAREVLLALVESVFFSSPEPPIEC
jgi:hypothetical protein